MISTAFQKAEQARRSKKLKRSVTPAQERTLEQRARETGMELPTVRNRTQASDALDRFEDMLRNPTLGPM